MVKKSFNAAYIRTATAINIIPVQKQMRKYWYWNLLSTINFRRFRVGREEGAVDSSLSMPSKYTPLHMHYSTFSELRVKIQGFLESKGLMLLTFSVGSLIDPATSLMT